MADTDTRKQISDILLGRAIIDPEVIKKFNIKELTQAQAIAAMEALIAAKEREARLEAANYFKKYMISTSPFIKQIVDPYIEKQEDRIAALRSEAPASGGRND